MTPQTIWVAGLLTVAFVAVLLWHAKHNPAAAGREPGVARGALRKIEVYLPVQAKPGCPRQVSEAYLSPDSRKLAYTNGRGLWLKSLDQVGPPQLVSTNRKCASPFWSPDSATIAWFEEEKLLARACRAGRPGSSAAWTPLSRSATVAAPGCATTGSSAITQMARFSSSPLWAASGRLLFPWARARVISTSPWPSPATQRSSSRSMRSTSKPLPTGIPTRGRKDIYKTTTDPLRGEIFTVGFAPSGHLFYADPQGCGLCPFLWRNWRQLDRRSGSRRIAAGSRLQMMALSGWLF